MLGRTSANLPTLISGQAIASPSSIHSNKRLCEAWPSSARSDLLFEPTSVLDINSPSPSSTLSSSIAISNESGPVPIESKVVAISGLCRDDLLDGQFLDCSSLSDATDAQIWDIAKDNGAAHEEEFAMGGSVVPSCQGSREIWADSGGQWDKFNYWQDGGTLEMLDTIEGPRLNERSVDDMMIVETFATGVDGNSKRCIVAQSKEKSSHMEIFERFSLSPRLLQGLEQEEAANDDLMDEVAGKGEVVDGKLEIGMISCHRSEMKRIEEAASLGEVVQRFSESQDPKSEELWLPEWMTADMINSEEKVTTQLGGMQCLEEVLLGSPVQPMQEWWMAELANAQPLVQQSQQHLHDQFQHRVGVGGYSQLRHGYYKQQLECGEAMNAVAATSPSSFRFSSSSSLLPTATGCPTSAATCDTFQHRSAISGCQSSPLPPKPNLSFPFALENRQFSAKFPHVQLQPSYHRSPHLLQQFSSVSANSRSCHPQLAPLRSPCRPPLAESSQHHSPGAQVISLPKDYDTQQQSVGLSERLHRSYDAEFLQRRMQCHLGTERRLQQHGGEHSFRVLPRSVPTSEKRQLQIPKLDLTPSWCVGKNVSLNELLLAGGQLSMAAKAAEQGDIGMTQAILARLNQENSPNGKPSQRAAFHFKQALAGGLPGSGSFCSFPSSSPLEIIDKIGAYKSFCEVSPLPQFAHFTANQAILEAVEGEDHVHLIDFSLGLGGQWASLMQELSQRSGGPPHLRITTVGGFADSLEMQLARETLLQFARELKVSLDFHALPVTRLDYLTASMFQLHEKEAITVNLGFSLDPFIAVISCANSFKTFLHLIKSLAPKVVTVIDNKMDSEDSASFVESLQFYACLFESLESSKLGRDRVLSIENVLFAPKIATYLNGQRRMGTLAPWRSLLQTAGFSTLNFSKAAETHAEYLIKSLNAGFNFDKQQGSLLLGWHNRPLMSASAWAC